MDILVVMTLSGLTTVGLIVALAALYRDMNRAHVLSRLREINQNARWEAAKWRALNPGTPSGR